MGKYEKLLLKILQGRSDHNIGFDEVRTIMGLLGFAERVKGSHHIFHKKEVEEIINLQESHGKAKAYQVKQVRNLILKYRLNLGEDES
jgi:predicted RNA binding protein YcfA (HicA-like mRNA interferase family)